MRVVILGSRGGLARALAPAWTRAGHELTGLGREDLDVSQPGEVARVLRRMRFDALVNCTGMTNVDLCESRRAEAEAVNAIAPGLMAAAARDCGAGFIHFSTDYVFDGEKTSPYSEEDEPRPLSWYGTTKRTGENTVINEYPEAAVVRVSWIFGPGKPAFPDMILRQAKTSDRVAAIEDKISCPTYARDVAGWIEPLLAAGGTGGIYHACNTGACSWREYAQGVLDEAASLGIPLQTRVVDGLKLSDMKAFVATRPVHTVLNTSKLATLTGAPLRPWREAMREYLSSSHA